MADFNIAYRITAIVEGGYVWDKQDNGGETYKGITRASEPNWKGWPIIEAIKKRVGSAASAIDREAEKDATLQAYVLATYKHSYWDALNLDLLQDQKVANELYDTGINMGTGRAGLFFQRTLNVVNRNGSLFPDLRLDGQIGAKTIGAFNSLSVSDKTMVWRLLNCLQGEKYISICEANPVQEKFIRSWASRVFENS